MPTKREEFTLKSRIKDYLVLSLAFVLFFSHFVFWTYQGDSFDNYLSNLASHSVSKKLLATYIFQLLGILLVQEIICRKVLQDKLPNASHKQRWVAYTLASLPIVIWEARLGIGTLFYSIPLAFIYAFYYQRKKRFFSLLFLQYTFHLALIPYCMLHTVFTDGMVREIFLFEYKKMHIHKKNLYYREGWGWVDKIHYREDHFKELKHEFEKQKETAFSVEIKDGWRTPLKIRVDVYRKYEIDNVESELDQWAIITGVMMDFMELSEQTQENSPWYHGNQLSAWQFDDMSSNLLACLDKLPENKKMSFINDQLDIPNLLKTWQKEGRFQIQKKTHYEDLWIEHPELKEFKELIDRNRKNWKLVD